ncbi:MAG: serine/threonine protein kinase, partial [Myxococcota bacterium]|nr:serine/threonine protein kinase [Myxococcota bacterium]
MSGQATKLEGTVAGGKYQVMAQLGTGSMGVVYEAQALQGGPRVALKVLRLDDATVAARFLREAKTMSLFQHANIVELLEVGKLDDGTLFFATELVRGSTLRDVLAAGPIDARRTLAIVRQILDALAHAHAMGVVHRDIKPENIMLADGGSPGGNDLVKMLDFGVAKLVGDTAAVLGEGTLTMTGYAALGTPYYMSPEAVLGRVIDTRADLYSVGVLTFEMLTGSPPFLHEDVSVLMRMHAAAPIPTLAERAPDRASTPELELVISEALAKRPELRFKTAAEMIGAVNAAIRSLEPVAPAEVEPAEARPPVAVKSTDLFGALPLKPPAAAVAPAPVTAALAPAPVTAA